MLPLIIGDDFFRNAVIKNRDGTPYNLAGCALWFTVTKGRGKLDTDAAVQLYWEADGVEDGITVDDLAAGIATVQIPAALTAEFVQAAYHYDLQLNDAAGRTSTVSRGVLPAQWSPTTRVTPL